LPKSKSFQARESNLRVPPRLVSSLARPEEIAYTPARPKVRVEDSRDVIDDAGA
jgi:hypothetical protein